MKSSTANRACNESRIHPARLSLTLAVYCILTFSACSESKDSKQKAPATETPSAAVTKQETPTAGSAQTEKPDASDTARVAKVKESSTAITANNKEAPLTAPTKPLENPTATKKKDAATETAPTTQETPPVIASKSPEAAASIPKKEDVATAKEPAVAPPLSLKMNIIGQRKEPDGSYTEVLVSEGSVLRSRDNFQVHLESNRPVYAYILMYDSEGKAGQIFPDPKSNQSGFIDSGRKLVVPSGDLWFWLDENTGTETIYVLASEKPLTDIKSLLAKMEGGDDAGQKRASQEIKQRITVMQRGVGGIVKGQTVIYSLSDGKKIQKVTDVVTGTGSVVRAVSFQHR